MLLLCWYSSLPDWAKMSRLYQISRCGFTLSCSLRLHEDAWCHWNWLVTHHNRRYVVFQLLFNCYIQRQDQAKKSKNSKVLRQTDWKIKRTNSWSDQSKEYVKKTIAYLRRIFKKTSSWSQWGMTSKRMVDLLHGHNGKMNTLVDLLKNKYLEQFVGLWNRRDTDFPLIAVLYF